MTSNRNDPETGQSGKPSDTDSTAPTADARCGGCLGAGRISAPPDWDWQTCDKCKGTGRIEHSATDPEVKTDALKYAQGAPQTTVRQQLIEALEGTDTFVLGDPYESEYMKRLLAIFTQSTQGALAHPVSPTAQSKQVVTPVVAITAKPVLKLVKAAVHDDPVGVKEAALEIAHEFELNGKEELAHYIYAQYNLVRTFEVTD